MNQTRALFFAFLFVGITVSTGAKCRQLKKKSKGVNATCGLIMRKGES
jgi:hypothetical protein